jgi:hypothetical protein
MMGANIRLYTVASSSADSREKIKTGSSSRFIARSNAHSFVRSTDAASTTAREFSGMYRNSTPDEAT